MAPHQVHLIVSASISTSKHHVIGNSGHDMSYAATRLHQLLLDSQEELFITTSSDYSDAAKWLKEATLLVTYCAGPFPNAEQNEVLRSWLSRGGRWVALHASNAGRHLLNPKTKRQYTIFNEYHETIGSRFLGHPPLHTFPVTVVDPEHPLTKGLPPKFDVFDELYISQPWEGVGLHPILTAFCTGDSSRYEYDRDAVFGDNKTDHCVAYTRDVGKGVVAYIGLGHCHNKWDGQYRETKGACVGPWETPEFDRILSNAIEWGISGGSIAPASRL